MSLGARGTKGGAKTAAKEKQDKPKTEKPARQEKVKPQATTEQLRMAHMIHRKSEDPSDVRRMVLQLMEMTCRTEEEVCSALHDADNDMEAACNMLLEDEARIQGEWQTSEKKKKKPVAVPEPPPPPPARRGGRGARRGARGGRGRPARTRGAPRATGSNTVGDSFPTTEDWDNEEWSGSLSDTKVFTPSSVAQNAVGDSENTTQVNTTEDWDAGDTNGPTESHIPTYTYHNTQSVVVNNVVPAANPPEPQENYHAPHAINQPRGMSGSLSAAQSQYLSQLTQQTRAAPPNNNSVYSSNYGVYGSGDISTQRKQRARVPPPSKIPVSAVEMPGGEGGMFLDVQFGALDPDTLQDKQPLPEPPAAPAPEPEPAAPVAPSHTNTTHTTHPASHTTHTTHPAHTTHTAHGSYSNNSSMLNESLSAVDTTPPSQPVTTESIVTNTQTSLEKQLTASMKQLSVSSAESTHHSQQYSTHQHRPKPLSVPAAALPVYAPPPLVTPNVYAPQVNSSAASLTAASQMTATAYPSSVTLTQYQPMINNYQTSSSATVYGGNALYTAYQHSQPHKQHKEPAQYDSTVASSNSLTSTSTTQTSTAKVPTTSQSVSAVNAAGTAASSSQPAAAAAAGYAGAMYSQYPAYDEQLMRSQAAVHHMGGYYEVGYGVGGAREGTFGLGAGERFGRTDAASPQQVPAAALPPGYAYFYQPPPTTYQYGVYPTYGGGSNVGGVGGGAAKLGTYAPQQPAYEQDNYKQAGPYTGNATKTAGAAAADLTNAAMYAKTHVALNKVNSYDKAAFHSGTPPPFGAGSHLYLPPQQPLHHHHHHQMDVRVNSSHNRRESAASSGRAAAKPAAAKPAYSQSYWAPN